MIQNKSDINEYIKKDLRVSKIPNLLELWLKGSESYPIACFIIALRHYEYYYNNCKLSVFGKIKKQYWRFLYRRYEIQHNLYIGVNVAESGLTIVHPGFRRFSTVAKIGHNCTILPMVLIGKKNPETQCVAEIGDNVYISTGVTILAPVKIGNNVTIGAGAVVTSDIPDNAIVGGVPAKIIKYKNID